MMGIELLIVFINWVCDNYIQMGVYRDNPGSSTMGITLKNNKERVEADKCKSWKVSIVTTMRQHVQMVLPIMRVCVCVCV